MFPLPTSYPNFLRVFGTQDAGQNHHQDETLQKVLGQKFPVSGDIDLLRHLSTEQYSPGSPLSNAQSYCYIKLFDTGD